MKVTLEDAKKIGESLRVNFDVITPQMLMDGMNVELEHGTVDKRTNVTNDDLVLTAKIALAHFAEGTNYYEKLHEMEKGLKSNPNIFLPESSFSYLNLILILVIAASVIFAIYYINKKKSEMFNIIKNRTYSFLNKYKYRSVKAPLVNGIRKYEF